MILKSGVIPLLHCLVTDEIMEGSQIKGIITESKSEWQGILAKRVIDATGDALDKATEAGEIPEGVLRGEPWWHSLTDA